MLDVLKWALVSGVTTYIVVVTIGVALALVLYGLEQLLTKRGGGE